MLLVRSTFGCAANGLSKGCSHARVKAQMQDAFWADGLSEGPNALHLRLCAMRVNGEPKDCPAVHTSARYFLGRLIVRGPACSDTVQRNSLQKQTREWNTHGFFNVSEFLRDSRKTTLACHVFVRILERKHRLLVMRWSVDSRKNNVCLSCGCPRNNRNNKACFSCGCP